MEEKAIKRRNWVKNIAIIFLSVMLVLTLFSNTIMNYSLPEVSAQYCYSGTITTRVRGSGTVEAKETYEVSSPSSSTVKDIGVKAGQHVEIGDVMFLLENEKDANLIEALEALAALKAEYNDTLGSLGGDYLDKQLAISEAQAAVTEARSKRAASNKAKEQLTGAKAEYKDAQKLVTQLESQKSKIDGKIAQLEAIEGIDEVNASLDAAIRERDNLKTALTDAEAALKEAENALETAKETAEIKEDILADAIAARDDFIAQNPDAAVDEATLTAKIREISDLERQYAYDIEDYQKAQADNADYVMSLYNKMLAAWDALQNYSEETTAASEDSEKTAVKIQAETNTETEPVIPAVTRESLEAAYNNAVKTYNDAANSTPESLVAMQRALEESAVNLQYKKQDLALLQQKYDNSRNYLNMLQKYKDEADIADADKKAADKEIVFSERAKNTAAERLTDARADYEDAKTMVDLLTSADSLESMKAESDSLDEQITRAEEQEDNLRDNVTELEGIKGDTVSDSALKSLENNVSKLQRELAAEMEANKASTEVVQMKLDIINKKITDKEAEIEQIKTGDFTTEVKAPVAGVIAAIRVVAGNKIQLNDPVADIQLVDKGYSITFNVTNEQAKRIKTGDRANIEWWWGGEINAVVESIKPDPVNPAQSKTVVLNISGEIDVGANLSFYIGERSMNYDSVVPNS
ncbi:MAG: HlyD family efflux transporter periplasmic adaptor subunit, partial [Eubacteriales bacterium]|nr:HlyD family efflux transporter periplasmic adaptor subunit [Eubacteriales bacterium]